MREGYQSVESLRMIQKIEAADSSHYFPDVSNELVYLACALAGEVGEACNNIKKNYRGSIPRAFLTDLLRSELADVLIYLVMLAEAAGVDLTEAWQDKKEFNDARYIGPPTTS